MPKYLLRRFAEMLITLFLIATATFFLLEAVPASVQNTSEKFCTHR